MTKTETKKPIYKRVISGICLTLSVLLFVFAAYIAIASTVARSKGEQPSVFGFYFSIVITESMHGEIEVGELIIYHAVDIDEVEVGDNVVFTALSGAIKGQSVVHKAIEVGDDDEGAYIRTQGVNNPASDLDVVRAGNLRGVVTGHSAFFGTVVSFFSNIVNVIIFFVVLGAFLIAIQQIMKIIRYILQKPDEDGEAPIAEEISSPSAEPSAEEISSPSAEPKGDPSNKESSAATCEPSTEDTPKESK